MKSKVLVIVLVLIIVALLIILGIKLLEKKPTPTYTLLREAEAIWAPEHTKKGRENVEDRIAIIRGKFEDMSGDLTLDLIKDHISPFFVRRGPGSNGPIRHARRYAVTHDGKLVIGQAFPGYLRSHLQEIDRINFELTWFISEEYSADPVTDDDFHHFLQFGFKVSYTMADGRLIDPPGGGGDYHIQECDWIDP